MRNKFFDVICIGLVHWVTLSSPIGLLSSSVSSCINISRLVCYEVAGVFVTNIETVCVQAIGTGLLASGYSVH